MMIDKIIAYPLLIKETIKHPPFVNHMRAGAYIPVKKRPSKTPQYESTFERLKEMFFEAFPKLDSEYKKIFNEA